MFFFLSSDNLILSYTWAFTWKDNQMTKYMEMI